MPRLVLAQYDRMIGLELDEIVVDGCITKAPGGGDKAGRSPVDRGKQGLKRSTVTDGQGIPLGIGSAGANQPDARLLAPTLAALADDGLLAPDATIQMDRGVRGAAVRAVVETFALMAVIARKGVPAPLQVGCRWVVERTQSWMNGFPKLQWCTERQGVVVDCYCSLAAAFVPTRRLINAARTRYRWDARPTTRRLK